MIGGQPDSGYLIEAHYSLAPQENGGHVRHRCSVWRQDENRRQLLSGPHAGLRRERIELLPGVPGSGALLADLASAIDVLFEREAPKLASALMSGLERSSTMPRSQTLAGLGIEISLEVLYEPKPLQALRGEIHLFGHLSGGRVWMMARALRSFDGSEPSQRLDDVLPVGVKAPKDRALHAIAAEMIRVGAARVAAMLEATPPIWPPT